MLDMWKYRVRAIRRRTRVQVVWDYAGDNYVHRLIQSDTEGKVVEYQRGDAQDKLDGIKLEYTCLLTSQLESQRMYFEVSIMLDTLFLY
ncbi:unnamed protein product [Strongylus vulgaris]|uniref:Uncharacterized protein n=1 Tax=Strongylus vulgaris TaxID=40348 RepID=A0A3P7JR50_STRVU|nr:unnamed protein product [Strongylus vulgaris]